ncbi:MAG: DUF2339 domain-containing protein [Bacillota bacterium]
MDNKDLHEVKVQVQKLEEQLISLHNKYSALEKQVHSMAGVQEKSAVPQKTKPLNKVSSNQAERKIMKERFIFGKEGLETKIGGTILNRIGIVAFLIGMAFFLKYAFDNQWVGPMGRVMIGMFLGLFFLAGGEYYQKKSFVKFAQGISGGGIVEAVVLTALGLMHRQRLLVYFGYGTLILGIVNALHHHWYWQYGSRYYNDWTKWTPVLNQEFVTIIAAIITLLLVAYFHYRWKDDSHKRALAVQSILLVFANLLFVFFVSLEISQYYWIKGLQFPEQAYNFRNFSQSLISVFLAVYSIILIAVGIWKRHVSTRLMAMVLFGFTIIKVFMFDLVKYQC